MQDLVSLLKARAHKRTQMSGTSYLTTHRTAHAVRPANTPYAGSSLCIRRLASMLCSAGASELSKIGQSPRNHNVFQSVATKSATLSFSHNLRPRIPQKQHYLFWFELSDVTVSRGQYPPCQVSLFTSSRLRLLVPDQRQIMRQDWQLPEELAPQPSFCHGETQNE